MTYRRPPTHALRPVPPEFADEFIRGGWRRIEHLFGARDDVHLQWIELSGGDELHRRRREFVKEFGTARRSVHGRGPVKAVNLPPVMA